MASDTHEVTSTHAETISLEALIDCMDRTAQNFRPNMYGGEYLDAQNTDEAYESIDALFYARPEVALEITKSEAAYGKMHLSDEEAVKLLLDIFMERNETKEE